MGVYLSATMSVIDGTTKFFVKNGNEAADRVLVSDSSGLVDWVGVRSLYSSERYVGELYGGGIVVGVWVEGGDEKVLIAALQDGTSTSQVFTNPPTTSSLVGWSEYTSTLANATSLYDGKSNYAKARSIYVWSDFGLTRAAVDLDTVPGGYSDWYLPSLYEMKMVYDAAVVINRTLKQDDNFKFDAKNPGTAKYWTSTEVNATEAWILDLTAFGGFVVANKITEARMRPVRLERKAVNNGLVTNMDVTNKLSYNDSTLSNRWVDLANYGLTSSYSFTFASINSTGPTYSPKQGGYLTFNGSSYVDFVSPLGDTTVVTVEMWARLSTGRSNYALFAFGAYSVFLSASGAFGFNTSSNSDVFGLDASQSAALGLVGNWMHYVFEMRSDVSYINNKIFVNGVEISLDNVLGSETSANRNFNGGIGRIGGQRVNTSYLAWCDISVFKVYNRVLTLSEVQEGYNKYRRKYEIGVPSTHFLDSGVGSGTFSITQNLVLDLQGKKNLKVLRSDQNGFASWVEKNYLFYRPDNQKFVGEVYGGGIIVASWANPANVFNYLIMSKTDLNTIVTELRYGGNLPTRLTVSYDFTSWLSVGQAVSLTIAGVLEARTISSIVSETGLATVATGTLNLPISDGPADETPGTPLVSPALFVEHQFVPTLLEVVVNINHSYVGDLVINLVAPNGNVINLMNRQNLNNANLTNTVFSSNLSLPSITTGTQPYTGTFRMRATSGVVTGAYTSNVTTLSGLMGGRTVNGNWYLVIVDGDIGVVGTLVNWSLRFSGTRTTILLNETRTATTTYQSSRSVQVGTTGLLVPWSSLVNTAISTTNYFDGSINSPLMMSQAGNTHSAALLADYYTSEGFGDWYLPSAGELWQAFSNLAAVGYVLGAANMPSGNYWSSTESSFSNAFSIVYGSYPRTQLTPGLGSKGTKRKVRAFRQVKVLANYKSWGDNDIWSEPTGDWYINPWDEANWRQYAGIRQSNLVFHFNTDNLQSYRGLTAGLTPTANSLVGGYTGTVLSQVAWSSDLYALQFNGVQAGAAGGNTTPTDSYLDFGTALALQSIPITLEAWIYPTYTTNDNQFKGIVSTCVPSGTSYWYGINLYISRNSNGTYNVGIFWANGNGTNQATDIRHGFTSNGPILPNQWSHVVGVMTGGDDISIYVNGKYVNTSLSGSSTQIGLNAAGKTMIGNFTGNVKYIFGGSIGAVRCYNTGLSATDVKNNFEKDRVRYGL